MSSTGMRGRHQGRQWDHEAPDDGEGDVEGGKDVGGLGPAEGERRVDAEHHSEAPEAVLNARHSEVEDEGEYHQG